MESSSKSNVAQSSSTDLYEEILGEDWERLTPFIKRFHRPGDDATEGRGSFDVYTGDSLLTRISQYFITAPRSGKSKPVRLRVVRAGDKERWTRKIGDTVLQTLQYGRRDGRMIERFGPCVFCFELSVRNGTLHYQQTGFYLGFCPLLVPLPDWLSPTIRAEERVLKEKGVLYVDVSMELPGGRTFVRYHGTIYITDS